MLQIVFYCLFLLPAYCLLNSNDSAFVQRLDAIENLLGNIFVKEFIPTALQV